MSKRKLLALVEDGHVDRLGRSADADDRRRCAAAATAPRRSARSADMIGVAKANSMVDIGKLEYCVRDDLNQQRAARARRAAADRGRARRAAGRAPTRDRRAVLPARRRQARLAPAADQRPRSTSIATTGATIRRTDYQRLAPGRTVRLRYGYCITADEVIARDAAGEVTKLRATRAPRDLGRQEPERRPQGRRA